MAEAIIQLLRETLPVELAETLSQNITLLEEGRFQSLLEHPSARLLFGHAQNDLLKELSLDDFPAWTDYVSHRLGLLVRDEIDSGEKVDDSPARRRYLFFLIGLAALGAFIQSNVTGPPLPFSSAEVLLPASVASHSKALSSVRGKLIESLTTDGEAVYKLTPNIELFCLSKAILTHQDIVKKVSISNWARLRINFIHQRLLSEIVPSLQSVIYEDLESVENLLRNFETQSSAPDTLVAFLLERATVHTHHGFDKLARADLEQAAQQRAFKFALTGLLGKRTKYQRKETSQLVVLARSAEQQARRKTGEDQGTFDSPKATSADSSSAIKPKTLDLNDDTLLESISFSEKPVSSVDVKDADSLPTELTELDPDNQPLLDPLDSIILLLLASSITNTSPSNGLTREETTPYAARVLEGGSSNWQIYTQALLIRSRIEGYRSRTVERGLLQLQALVDQVIADTSFPGSTNGSVSTEATTFLPRPKDGESAPVQQRLLYIYQLCSPMRWELEAELAARWISLGGLRSAVEIYERLEMWAELALCWAATERDDKARKVVRKQLFRSTSGESDAIDEDVEKWEGEPRDPPPTDAPRLYCILGDLDKDPSFYEKAWETSNCRYYRAQRSLGRYWYGQRDYVKASLAYSKAVKVKQQDHPTWFALGCALLELDQFSKAAEAFTRAVQLDDGDAESWSNLAAALLHLEPEESTRTGVAETVQIETANDPDGGDDASLLTIQEPKDPQKNRKDALKALKQAARLKRNNYRIWDNLLTVAASLHPPSFTDVITSQQRIIDLRGKTDGEKCIDENVLDALVKHITSQELNSSEDSDPTRPGLSRMVCRLVDRSVIPLITSSSRLWYIVARLALWRDKPSASLDANEKAWRAITGSGWEYGTKAQWDSVVDATVSLIATYESLGPREKTEGLSAGTGELVCKTWKFKIRTAVRGILGRGKSTWEGTEGWKRLTEIGEAARG